MSDNALISARQLTKSYHSKGRVLSVLHHVDADFSGGTFYCLIGRSGCGKSTLLRTLAGMQPPDSGEVLYKGTSLYQAKDEKLRQFRSRETGFVFQDYSLLSELTVAENIRLPSVLSEKEISQDWYEELLTRLGLKGLTNAFPDEISGGQQQRCAIGRAAVLKPPVLFADEPTGNLDRKTAEEVLDLLLEIRDSYGPAIIMATHDLDIARCADITFYMENGILNGGRENEEK